MNSLGGGRGGGGETKPALIEEMFDNLWEKLVRKCGCHRTPYTRSWTTTVHNTMLEQTLTKQPLSLVLSIMGGTGIFSYLTCGKPSDLTSILVSSSTSSPNHWNKTLIYQNQCNVEIVVAEIEKTSLSLNLSAMASIELNWTLEDDEVKDRICDDKRKNHERDEIWDGKNNHEEEKVERQRWNWRMEREFNEGWN